MPRRRSFSAVPMVVALLLVLAGAALAKGAAPTDGTGPLPANRSAPAPITLVVFDFKVQQGMRADTGERIADALSARLAQEQGFRVVPRADICAGLEKEGLEPPTPGERVPAVEGGHLLGAELAIFGRAFASDGSNYLIAKIVSTGDLTLSGVIVRGWLGEEQIALAVRLAHRLTDLLQDRSSKTLSCQLLPQRARRLRRMKEWLKKWTQDCSLPRIAVVMSESHLGQQLPQSVCEAAATKLLLDAGLDAYACGTPESQQWARGLRWRVNARGREAREAMQDLPPGTEGADLLIVGHGWSSTTARHGSYGRLAICDSRVETKVIDLATGLLMGEESGAWGLALGRTEEEAARKALERAGVTAAASVRRHIERWMEQHPSTAEKQESTDGRSERSEME